MPSAADDRPAWGKVAVLAVVGFAVGIAWPRFAGVRLGPSAPAESIPAASRPSGAAGDPASNATPASLTAAAEDGGAAGATNAGGASTLVTVQRGAVLSCRNASGDLQKGPSNCGDLAGLDALVTPRLRKLATCPAAAGQSGKLSVVLGVDFAANRVTAGIGKSSTVPAQDALASCLHAQLDALTLAAIHHDQPKYTVQYTTTLGAGNGAGGMSNATPAAAAATATSTAPPDPGAATAATPSGDERAVDIVWDVAIVRDTPRTGSVLARLSRGTKIHVAASQDGWYRVKYGSGFSSEGWVYRGAIGK